MKNSKFIVVGVFVLLVAVLTGIVYYASRKRDTTTASRGTGDTGNATSTVETTPTPTLIASLTTGVPDRVIVSTSGTVAAGKRFVQITNVGSTVGTITVGSHTTNLVVGLSYSFDGSHHGKLSPAFPYDATGTQFLIETLEA